MPLNKAQREAVEYLSGPLLVLAGPGTGKTQLLSAKVAYILEQTDANPENILCLTFTDAGAENMCSRLQTMIGKSASDVNIYTYHAFGKNLLDRYQNYAETPERRLENAVDETLQYQIITKIQKQLSALDILRTADPKDIIETISNAKSARLSSSDLEKIVDQNISDSEVISQNISPILEAAPKGLRANRAIPEVYQPILESLVELISKEPIVGSIERLANTMSRELSGIIEKTESMPKPDTKLLSAWKKKYFEPDDHGHYRLTDHIANKKLRSLANIMRRYEEYLAEHKLYDFDDMIECAIQYLRTDRGFRLSLSELFQYVLLDEFQDTNTSQFELIKLITDYENPVIMAVGDDDQAIYAFQGANASNLMDFREHYNANVISLTQNYRSTGEILALSRHIADQIGDSFAKSYPDIVKVLSSEKDAAKALLAKVGAAESDNTSRNLPSLQKNYSLERREQPENDSKISRHEFPCSEAEYFWVANEVRRLLDSKEKASEIAIIAPKHKYLVAILPYLKDQGIDIAYEKRENLLDDPRIHEIITMAKFIARLAAGKQPSDLLPEILSYDFWAIPSLDILKLFSDRFNKKPTLEYLDSPEFEPHAKFFADLALKSLTTPLELWLNYLIGASELNGYTSPFLAYYKDHSTPAELLQFYENLSTFRQTVMAHAQNLGGGNPDFTPKLADFVTTIEDYEAANSEIMRISNYEDSPETVQVMTAFKSKGLEFKHVFLIAVDDTCWGKGKGNNNKLALPKNLTQIRHTGVTDDERLRILFVALTRAKESLTLTSSRATTNGKTLNRLCYLNEGSFEDAEPLSPYLPELSQKIHLHKNELDSSAKTHTLALSWTARYQNLTPELETLLLDRVKNYRISASDLTGFINLTYAGPQAIYNRLLLHAPDSPSTTEQIYGTLIHKVFEEITNQGLDDEAAMQLFAEYIPSVELEDDEKSRLQEISEHSLRIALEKFGETLRRPNARGEVNLSSEHPTWNGIPLTGKIDHLEINPENKTIEVYDFKTGKYRPESWNSHPTAYMHRLQLGFYKLLLNQSPTFAKYTVTRGHILYVTPDDEDKVYDKLYDFNEKDELELKALIEAAYHQIVSLNFVHDPEIFLESDKSANMTAIREFVTKIISAEAEKSSEIVA